VKRIQNEAARGRLSRPLARDGFNETLDRARNLAAAAAAVPINSGIAQFSAA